MRFYCILCLLDKNIRFFLVHFVKFYKIKYQSFFCFAGLTEELFVFIQPVLSSNCLAFAKSAPFDIRSLLSKGFFFQVQ